MIITVTGLKLKSPLHWLAFWRHAVPSFNQCRQSTGCLHAETFAEGGFQHTLTAFDSRDNLRRFAMAGPHRKAAKAFRRIAVGKILSWDSETLPTRDEAVAIWEAEAEWY